jgi:drug/metabolite transporter (DMT)-like permease
MVILSSALWPLMDAVAKHLVERGVPPFQVAWGRHAANLVLLLPLAWRREGAAALLPRLALAHLARASLPALVAALLFVGLREMPFAPAIALLFAYPLLIVLFSAVFLRERVGAARWAAVIAGFAGALVVLRPGAGVLTWASIAPLAAAAGFAATVILNRRLAGEASPLATTLHYAVAGSVVLLPGALPGWTPLDGALLAWFAAMAVLGGAAMWLVTVAYERADASVLAPFHFAELAAAIPVGLLLFGEVPDPLTWVGIGIILVTGVVATRRAG